jgi:hypothetical protein
VEQYARIYPKMTVALALEVSEHGSVVSGLYDHVRFGSKGDMCSAQAHVCLTPKSGDVRCNWGQKEGHRG